MRWTDTGDTNEKNESKVNHMRWTESTVGAKSIILHVELHGKEKKSKRACFDTRAEITKNLRCERFPASTNINKKNQLFTENLQIFYSAGNGPRA
jgi:hypothetical protein